MYSKSLSSIVIPLGGLIMMLWFVVIIVVFRDNVESSMINDSIDKTVDVYEFDIKANLER